MHFPLSNTANLCWCQGGHWCGRVHECLHIVPCLHFLLSLATKVSVEELMSAGPTSVCILSQCELSPSIIANLCWCQGGHICWLDPLLFAYRPMHALSPSFTANLCWREVRNWCRPGPQIFAYRPMPALSLSNTAILFMLVLVEENMSAGSTNVYISFHACTSSFKYR